MRKYLLMTVAASMLGCLGCAKSVEDEARDVREAQQRAAENIAEEQRDVRQEQIEAGAEIREEQRELDQAIDDARTDGDPTTP
ncbi:MAG: hypothetical protein KF708_14850 [Pirellulales bacterium]|nr:hypothetical protein [Pirellulales bacterium]